jgi:uncharacterized damage-inducible protein DinB
MTATSLPTATFFAGWQTYQNSLIMALSPLSAEQLALRAGPGLRSIEQITAHIVAALANWFFHLLQEGGNEFAKLGTLDRPGEPTQGTAELLQGLETTWQGMQAALARWSPAEWQQTYTQSHAYACLCANSHHTPVGHLASD